MMKMCCLTKRAAKFIQLFYHEKGLNGLKKRLQEIKSEIDDTGTYTHTKPELEYGAKVAWRNSNRCIGRLFYETLKVFDERKLNQPVEIFQAVRRHLHYANNNGKIRPAITIFKPENPVDASAIRILNPKIIRYAGYETTAGITGDPGEVEFTNYCKAMGWNGQGTNFDVLPLIIQTGSQKPQLFELNQSDILEVSIEHPDFKWFTDLRLKWYAVPVISDMVLEIGGIHYTAAPFNGWFMGTEIASRNLGDENRYNMLPHIAKKLGINLKSKTSLWKDRALLELNRAVIYSFRKCGIRIVDHHTASRQFMKFTKIEEENGRQVMADWAWIVPPMSGSATEVFHRSFDNRVVTPNFFYSDDIWKAGSQKQHHCPFHISSIMNNE